MNWLGGIVLGLGVLLVAALAGYKIVHFVRRRAGSLTKRPSYGGRLDLEVEHGEPDEIDEMAATLIREHGADAVIKAARRTLSRLDEGDRKSQAVWHRVLQSAEESQRKEGQDDEAAE